MKYHLISGGCGFVGRNIVKRLWQTTDDMLIVVDDLSVGTHPSNWDWLQSYKSVHTGNVEIINQRIYFFKLDFRVFLRNLSKQSTYLSQFGLSISQFDDVFHFAAIVGGRATIDGDPMKVALDLSIDTDFFYWVCQHKPTRVLFPSSSAAYPTNLQGELGAVALKETYIDFEKDLGTPDMTYGWSKLTGEYLAQIAAKHYGISVACVRPFSGYGEDQDLSYPIPAIAARAARKEAPFEVWGTGKQGRDFVHIDDCVDAIFMAMDKVSDGSAINIGSGKLTSFLEIIEIFCELANYSPEIKQLLNKPVGVQNRYADMSYVQNTFGWQPKVSLREGLERVYRKALKNE